MAPDDVHIWYRLTDSLTPSELAAADEALSPAERARRDRFHQPHDRRDYAVAHDLLRRSLSFCHSRLPSEWQFDTTERGRPILVPSRDAGDGNGPALSFSLSHTRGLVACAVSAAAAVGVDVERITSAADADEIAGFCLSERETRRLDGLSQTERCTRVIEVWTLKEAFVKAIGAGLSYPVRSLSFDIQDDGRIRFESGPDVEMTAWRFAMFAPCAESRLAAALFRWPGPADTLVARDASSVRPLLTPFRATS